MERRPSRVNVRDYRQPLIGIDLYSPGSDAQSPTSSVIFAIAASDPANRSFPVLMRRAYYGQVKTP
jgi:hypothetical protein